MEKADGIPNSPMLTTRCLWKAGIAVKTKRAVAPARINAAFASACGAVGLGATEIGKPFDSSADSSRVCFEACSQVQEDAARDPNGQRR